MRNPSCDTLNLRAYWAEAWRGLERPADEPALRDVAARYRDPRRVYHTLAHLADCFAPFEDLRSASRHPAEVLMAIWFHDAIYDTRSSHNEAASAELACAVLTRAAVAPASIDRVGRMIRATRHAKDSEPSSVDEAVLLDVDLAVLGAPAERFDAYDRAIRREYAWVADAEYRAGRAAVLRAFLQRPRLYATERFHQRYETAARLNLERALRRLGE